MTEKLQQQISILSEELCKQKEEKCQALARTENLELEMESTRESERKMLDSLVRQTKQLEQTKISLEESKLEIKHLNDTIKYMGDPKEKLRIRVELKLALDAEAKSKKAMDELAVVLKEVSTECNCAKKSYFQAQSELEKAQEEAQRLRIEVDESTTAWQVKESGFLNCIKMSEEEITYMKIENERLHASKKAAREEISNLRDIVKQAIRESTAVKEALEITRDENSQLKKVLLERECTINDIKHSYESLKVTERAAVDSVKELSGLLAATVSLDSKRCSQSFDMREEVDEDEEEQGIAKFPSDNWTKEWNTVKLLEGSIFDELTPMSPRREKSGRCGDASGKDDCTDEGGEKFFDAPFRLKKKRHRLRKFGNMLRMASHQRPWSSEGKPGSR